MASPKPTNPAAPPVPTLHDTPPSLRNPDLARPPPRVTRPGATRQAGGSVASNGYWLHDAAGPRHLVTPAADPQSTYMIAAIRDRLAALPDLDASRVHFRLEGSVLRLVGLAADAEARRRIGACATAVTATLPDAPRIENRLRIAPPADRRG